MSTLTTTAVELHRLEPKPLPPTITCVQPGRGWVMQFEMAWGKLRRAWLRAVRPGYVARMRGLRQGECPNCPHDIVDPRDLKFLRNVCGYWFAPEHDRFAWRGRLKLARWGLAELLVFAGAFVLLAAGMIAAAVILNWPWLGLATIVPVTGAIFVVSFFRDPTRQIPTANGRVVSPADGTVDDIEELEHCEFLDGPAVKIGIFLSVFNVHINRAPERARVIELKYFRGKFGNALRPETAKDNEQLWIALEADDPPHRRMLVKQIVGAIARRIVCEARPGEVLARGQKFGMIKFGSRTELYLPKEGALCVTVKPHMSVRGGVTVLARYAESDSTP
jgi:phosphatidylserine decarboxylase